MMVKCGSPEIEIYDRPCAIVGTVASAHHIPHHRDLHLTILSELSFPTGLEACSGRIFISIVGQGNVVNKIVSGARILHLDRSRTIAERI